MDHDGDDGNNGHLGVADDSHGDGGGEHPGKGHVAAHLKFQIITSNISENTFSWVSDKQ